MIKAFKDQLASFACEACGDDMGALYGALGDGYIEAHHRVPVADLKEGESTRLSDLAALCPNCHRVIHRNGLMSVEALATYLDQRHLRQAFAAEPKAARWTSRTPDDEG